MKLRRAIVMMLAMTSVFFGFFMAYRVLLQFRENTISQHREKLADVANSVDRSAQGFFQIYHDSLEYVTGRRGFLEAQDQWAQTGQTDALQYRLAENLLHQDMHVRTILAMDGGQVILSADGSTGYQIPARLDKLFLCRDADGTACLGILHRNETLAYAAVIDLIVLCEYLAESSAVNASDWMLLLDRDGQVLICHHEGKTAVQPLNEQTLAQSPARSIAYQALGTTMRQVSLFETGLRWKGQGRTTDDPCLWPWE